MPSLKYSEVINNFKTDCEKLIKVFQEKQSLHFKDFSVVWKAFGFNLIYEKYLIQYQGDERCFKEDSLQIAKSIMLQENFVSGIFLLFSLYYMQEDPKASIGIELEEFLKLTKLVQEERLSLKETCGPGFLFARLLSNEAFSFVSFSREYAPDVHNRALVVHGGCQNSLDDFKIQPGKEWFDNFLEKIDSAENVKNMEKKYLKKKQKLLSEFPEMNLVLDMEPQDFITGLDTVLSNPESSVPTKPEYDIGTKRKRLKNRKMKIKQRYAKPTDIDGEEEESSIKLEIKRKKLRYQRKRFFVTAKRHSRQESEDDSDDDEDEVHDDKTNEPVLALPDIGPDC